MLSAGFVLSGLTFLMVMRDLRAIRPFHNSLTETDCQKSLLLIPIPTLVPLCWILHIRTATSRSAAAQTAAALTAAEAAEAGLGITTAASKLLHNSFPLVFLPAPEPAVQQTLASCLACHLVLRVQYPALSPVAFLALCARTCPFELLGVLNKLQ
eukprot:TRINITY_DN3571_c0_g2_i1.p1 TRINITY_DN3571_c0_g2~~TRINITY_DN3571_c0_g2_i1.p1  ORF type:complete len:155 (-),score=8.93 TRINITY_DN3571_c0_g2_i1:853-1317(-)